MRLRKLTALIAASAIAITSLTAGAADQSKERAALDALLKKEGIATPKSVKKLQGTDLWEVTDGNFFFYIDVKAKVLISGEAFELGSKKNLTSETRDRISTIDPKTIPSGAFKVVYGKGSDKALTILSDPDCPFCKQLEQTLAGMDVTVEYLPYPLEAIHPDARAKSMSILCSKDPAKAWANWWTRSVLPDVDSCQRGESILNNVSRFAIENGLFSTPTLIFPDGKTIGGAAPKEKIERALASGS